MGARQGHCLVDAPPAVIQEERREPQLSSSGKNTQDKRREPSLSEHENTGFTQDGRREPHTSTARAITQDKRREPSLSNHSTIGLTQDGRREPLTSTTDTITQDKRREPSLSKHTITGFTQDGRREPLTSTADTITQDKRREPSLSNRATTGFTQDGRREPLTSTAKILTHDKRREPSLSTLQASELASSTQNKRREPHMSKTTTISSKSPLQHLWEVLQHYDYDWSWWDIDGSTRIPRASYEGKIAGAPSLPLNSELLLKDFPHLQENFIWISHAFISKHARWEGTAGAGPRNAKLGACTEQLLSGSFAEKAPRSRKGCCLHSAFCVPKRKPGELRFILACQRLNQAMAHIKLPPCQFPSYTMIVDTVLSGAFFCEFDFKSWFFQFNIEPAARPFFAFRCNNAILWMTRLAMGYRASPQLGQAVTRCLGAEAVANTQAEHISWLDNTVFVADSAEILNRVKSNFEAICARYGVIIGDTSPISRQGTMLGLHFDCIHKRWKMDPAWVEKLKGSLQISMLEAAMPLRFWWRMCGLILWRVYALQLHLYEQASLLSWMSEVSKDGVLSYESWSREVTLPLNVRASMQDSLGQLLQNPWRIWSPPPTDRGTAHTDASLTGWCFIVNRDGKTITRWGLFTENWLHEDIAVLEMYAFYRMVMHICEDMHMQGVRWRVGVDNTAVIGAWRKGFSHAKHILNLLMKARRIADTASCRFEMGYVKSEENPADDYTRLRDTSHPYYTT